MKIELKNIKYSDWGSEETHCFKADLYLNGKKIGHAENDGKGGNTNYYGIEHHWSKDIKLMEEYCKTLPPIVYDSSLIGKKMSIDMNLEHYIDDLISKHLQQKEEKKMEKQMTKSILIGNKSSYQIISFKVPLKDVWEKHPQYFSKTLKESMEKYAKNGYQLLNNNIPQQFLN